MVVSSFAFPILVPFATFLSVASKGAMSFSCQGKAPENETPKNEIFDRILHHVVSGQLVGTFSMDADESRDTGIVTTITPSE